MEETGQGDRDTVLDEYFYQLRNWLQEVQRWNNMQMVPASSQFESSNERLRMSLGFCAPYAGLQRQDYERESCIGTVLPNPPGSAQQPSAEIPQSQGRISRLLIKQLFAKFISDIITLFS